MKGIELLLASLCINCTMERNENNRTNMDNPYPNNQFLASTAIPIAGSTDSHNDHAQVLDNRMAALQYLRELREWLSGKHLRIATLEDYPLSYTIKFPNGTRKGKGVAFELIDFLQDKFNFTYDVVVPEKNIIGSNADFRQSLLEKLNKSVIACAQISIGLDRDLLIFQSHPGQVFL